MTTGAVAVLPIEGTKTEAIHVWSAIGIFFLTLQLYIYGSWITSEDFAPVNPGPDVHVPLRNSGPMQ